MKAGITTLIIGIVLGVAALATFDGVMHATSTEDFCCSSCH